MVLSNLERVDFVKGGLREDATDSLKTPFKGLILESEGFINRIKKRVTK
jgi:hypothetical protein